MEPMKKLSIRLYCDFKFYTKCLFDFGETSSLVIGKKHEIEGFTYGLLYAGIMTMEQRGAILRELQRIFDKYWERYLRGIATVQKDEIVKELVAKAKEHIEAILIAREESR